MRLCMNALEHNGWMVTLLALVALAFASDHWPQFRGPDSLGVVEDPALPDKWSATENVAWKVEIPGVGWSSPIVWGDRVFVTSVISSVDGEKPKKGLYFGGERKAPADEHRWMVYAVDFKTGKILWEKEAHHGVPPGPRHLKNSYASETPVTDGERVYAYFGNVGLFCYDMKGKLLWSKPSTFVKTRFGWGTAASPVLHQGRIYVVNDNDDKSYLAALDKKTGDVIWRMEREEKTNWSTPYIWEHNGKTEIVTTGTGRVRSYDLDGRLLWQFGGMSSIVIPTPFSSHGMLYPGVGLRRRSEPAGVRGEAGAQGDLSLAPGETSNAGIAWYLPQAGPYNPSPIVYGDIYYHSARPRLPHCARRADRQGDLWEGANRPGGWRIHGIALGGEWKAVPVERGWRYVRGAGGARVQTARQEYAG